MSSLTSPYALLFTIYVQVIPMSISSTSSVRTSSASRGSPSPSVNDSGYYDHVGTLYSGGSVRSTGIVRLYASHDPRLLPHAEEIFGDWLNNTDFPYIAARRVRMCLYPPMLA